MFFSFSRAPVSAATVVVAIFWVIFDPGFGLAQNARPNKEPAKTAQVTPPRAGIRPFEVVRQDLFDRRNSNNLRSDYAPPPAQPGQH
jgi:hypothetical protein